MLSLLAALALLPSVQLGWKAGTPEPILDGNPRWVDLYWKSWENLHAAVIENEGLGPLPSGIVAPGKVVSFDGSMAIALWGRWAWRASYARQTLEFALLLVDNGGRAGKETNGALSTSEAVGIPMSSLAAWRLYTISGEQDVAKRTLPALIRRHAYIATQYSAPVVSEDGKKKAPRIVIPPDFSPLPAPEDFEGQASADAVALELQDAVFLRNLAKAAGERDAERVFGKLSESGAATLAGLWDPKSRAFAGRGTDGEPSERRSLLPLFGILGGELSASVSADALAALGDPRLFYRRTLYPLVPRSDGEFSASSGAKPLYTYLTIRALLDAGQTKQAARAAESVLRVYEAAAGKENALFADYGPDTRAPAPNATPGSLAAGLITVSALIEAVIGIDVDAPNNTVTWNLRRTDRHGLHNLLFGANAVDLEAAARKDDEPPTLTVTCREPFTLVLTWDGKTIKKRFDAGNHEWRPDFRP
jgi:hypothetical protein